MKLLKWILALGATTWLFGCAGPQTVTMKCRFDPNQPLTYRFTSSRQVNIQWGSRSAAGEPNQTSTINESLRYTMTYTPLETLPDGSTRLKATCTEARVHRSNSVSSRRDRRADAAESLAGQSFTVVIDPQGRLTDAHELDALLKILGQKAFRKNSGSGRVKDPEMISDIIATQWFFLDALGSRPHLKTAVGQSWTSRQLIPAPMVIRRARDITYTLARERYTKKSRIAEITSTSTLSPDKCPSTWPIPYSGTFQVAGTFGFLRGYHPESLQGTGLDRFNLDTGTLISSEHTFTWVVQTQALPLTSIQASPKLIITQTLKAEQQS